MNKCPNCNCSCNQEVEVSFEDFMDLTIKRVANKQKKEYGYGIQEKDNQRSNNKARKK